MKLKRFFALHFSLFTPSTGYIFHFSGLSY
jgi:hypothetical protein